MDTVVIAKHKGIRRLIKARTTVNLYDRGSPGSTRTISVSSKLAIRDVDESRNVRYMSKRDTSKPTLDCTSHIRSRQPSTSTDF